MRALVSVLFLISSLLLSSLRAEAQSWIDQPFDPRQMSREDTATLQAALSFSGDYYGFLDGVWNDDAQTALVAYVKRTRGGASPTYRDLEDLILDLEDERVKNNWQLYYDQDANISYLHPFGLITQLEDSDELEFLSADKEFSMIVRYENFEGMKSNHDWFMSKAKPGSDPYQFSDKSLWITSATVENDFIAYARSDLNKGTWMTLSIVITQQYFNHLNLLASSVMVGGSPATLIWTENGVIDQLINGDRLASTPPAVADAGSDFRDQVRRPLPPGVAEVPSAPATDPGPAPVEVATPDEPPATDKPAAPILGTPAPGSPAKPPLPEGGEMAEAGTAVPPAGLGTTPVGAAPIRAPGTGAGPANPGALGTPPPEKKVAETPKAKVSGTLKGSGTGFYIAPTTLVTAAHVIDGCRAVALADGTPLEVLAADVSLDVAVLGGATDAGAWLKLSALEVPKLGEAVTALGYPYSTSLEQGLTVTSGNVSALRGADGSSNRVMITAPVQPGNSGGPLLNKKGAVIGVVVSRMDDLAVLEETGSLPQNMNFAVPSGPLLTFLAQHRITRPQGDGTSGEMSGEVPAGVASAVVALHCYQ